MPFVYRLTTAHTLSPEHLRRALQHIIRRHQALRTSILLDAENDLFIQHIMSEEQGQNNTFSFVESTYETDEQLKNIVHDEQTNCHHFDLSRGVVFRFHIVYHKQKPSSEVLSMNDVLIFNFHHAIFDLASMDIFLDDLNRAYTTGQLANDDRPALRYLDYATIEQRMPMTGAEMFWLDVLHNCNIDQPLPLPYDRYRVVNEHATGHETSISFAFDADVSHDLLTYASTKQVTLQHLALATYYAFLFKLTSGEKDLCIGMSSDGRYRDELRSIIGLFESVIPLRCQLDPHWSLRRLLDVVCDVATKSMKYSYFPLRRILNQHQHASAPTFLRVLFDFQSDESKHKQQQQQQHKKDVLIGDAQLHCVSTCAKWNRYVSVNELDLSFSIQHDIAHTHGLICTIDASLDLFYETTVDKMAHRFGTMLQQLFLSPNDEQMERPIYELSLMSVDERIMMMSMNNTQVAFPCASCIHHEFAFQAMQHSQKVAVELDEQSLTYSELLYSAQLLSLHLLNSHRILPGEIICQCVERSLSMVIGMMAIEMAGDVYCPLSARDPQHRLHLLIEETQSRLVFAHWLTKNKFNSGIVLVNIDSVVLNQYSRSDGEADDLSGVSVSPGDIAYTIFTSGSTGIPKAVQITHRSFVSAVRSLISIRLIHKEDIVLQMAGCLYDVHLQETIGVLLVGSTVALLSPTSSNNINDVLTVAQKKQVSYMQTVPAYLASMMDIMLEQGFGNLEYLKTLDIGGDASSVQLLEKAHNCFSKNTLIWNTYGPAEATVNCTFHKINCNHPQDDIPMGHLFANYICVVLDEFLENVINDQEGELYIGGAGVFAGYLGREDLTQKALVHINDEVYYRTGDLVKIDCNSRLHYQGRKDHQVKLHGQRIELGEI
ncbi:unnamed protein product, partial [Adineta ricciae]